MTTTGPFRVAMTLTPSGMIWGERSGGGEDGADGLLVVVKVRRASGGPSRDNVAAPEGEVGEAREGRGLGLRGDSPLSEEGDEFIDAEVGQDVTVPV